MSLLGKIRLTGAVHSRVAVLMATDKDLIWPLSSFGASQPSCRIGRGQWVDSRVIPKTSRNHCAVEVRRH